MQINCPKCQSQLDVPDDAAGKETTCPSCQETFVVAGPVQTKPAEGVAPPAAPAGDNAPARDKSAGAKAKANEFYGKATTMQLGGFSLMKIVAAAGGILLFLSFFLPWWGMGLEFDKVDAGDVSNARSEYQKVFDGDASDDDKADANWVFSVAGLEEAQEMGKAQGKVNANESVDYSWSAFGWDLTRGIVTFIFALEILVLVGLTILIPSARRVGFALLLPAALLAFVVLILTLTVWFGTPGDNEGEKFIDLYAGVSFGTFVAMFGAIGVMVGAGLEGVFSLLGFIKGSKS
ncbi:MAG: hypothetical protein ACLFUJ_01725 [Phycisphaerae bacterium]